MVYKRAYHKRLPSYLIFTVKVYTAYLLGARGLSFRSEAVIEILARVDRQTLDRGFAAHNRSFATKIIKKKPSGTQGKAYSSSPINPDVAKSRN